MDFWIYDLKVLAIFDLQVTLMLPTKFSRSTGLLVQEKKRKIDFQDGHLGSPIGTILAIFDLQVTMMLPTELRVNWPFGFRRRSKKIDFQDGRHVGHLGFPIRMILATFDQVTPMLPTKFQVNWPFGSGEEAKNTFFKMDAMAAIWDLNDLKLFLIYKSSRCFLPRKSQFFC